MESSVLGHNLNSYWSKLDRTTNEPCSEELFQVVPGMIVRNRSWAVWSAHMTQMNRTNGVNHAGASASTPSDGHTLQTDSYEAQGTGNYGAIFQEECKTKGYINKRYCLGQSTFLDIPYKIADTSTFWVQIHIKVVLNSLIFFFFYLIAFSALR